MRLGLCCTIDQLAAAAAAGYDCAELTVGEALVPEEDEAAFAPRRDAILAAPLPVAAVNCFVPGHLKLTGPAVDLARVEAYMAVALRRAGACGIGIVVLGSAGARAAPADYPKAKARLQFLEAARVAGELAAARGVTLALEPIVARHCNIFNLVSEGAAFVDTLDHPAVRLLADLYHVAEAGEPLARVAAAGARLAHAHLPTPALPETSAGAAYDFAGFFTALRAAGYDGRVTVEDNPGLLRGAGARYPVAIAAVRRHLLACIPA